MAAALAGKLAAAEERKAAVCEGVRERPRSANAHREAQVAELRARERERAVQAAEVRAQWPGSFSGSGLAPGSAFDHQGGAPDRAWRHLRSEFEV